MEDVVSERSWVRNPLMPSTPTRSLAAFSSDQSPRRRDTLSDSGFCDPRRTSVQVTCAERRPEQTNPICQRRCPAYRFSQGRQCSDKWHRNGHNPPRQFCSVAAILIKAAICFPRFSLSFFLFRGVYLDFGGVTGTIFGAAHTF